MSLRRSLLCCISLASLAALGALGAGCSGDRGDDVASGEAAQTQSRPPQLVLMGFDGSLNLAFWEESLRFARENNIKFTYWISGVYFIPDAKKSAKTFTIQCKQATKKGYTVTATGSGVTNDFVFSIDESGQERTDKLPPRWGSAPADCWVTKRGGTC